MRQRIVNLHLYDLRIDHDEPQLFRRVAEEQTRDDRVDANALSATGCSRDEQVRHFSEVADDRVAVNIHAKREGQFSRGFTPDILLEKLAERDFHFLRVRNFNTHGVLARNRCQNVNPLGAGCSGDVSLQCHDFVNAHADIRVDLVAGNRGSFRDRSRRRLDAELRQGFNDEILVILQLLAVEWFAIRFIGGIQQLSAWHDVVLEMHIDQSRRKRILGVAGGSQFGELRLFGGG